MAKQKTVYVCDKCGYESPKWFGRCPVCGEWNTAKEFQLKRSSAVSRNHAVSRVCGMSLDQHSASPGIGQPPALAIPTAAAPAAARAPGAPGGP